MCTTRGGPDCSSRLEPGLEDDDSGGDICVDGMTGLAAPAKRIVKLMSAISDIDGTYPNFLVRYLAQRML